MKTQFSELSTVEAISVLKEMGDGANAGALASLVEGHPNLGSVRLSDLPESEVLARASWRGTEHTKSKQSS